MSGNTVRHSLRYPEVAQTLRLVIVCCYLFIIILFVVVLFFLFIIICHCFVYCYFVCCCFVCCCFVFCAFDSDPITETIL